MSFLTKILFNEFLIWAFWGQNVCLSWVTKNDKKGFFSSFWTLKVFRITVYVRYWYNKIIYVYKLLVQRFIFSKLKRYFIEKWLSLSCVINKTITPSSYGHYKGLHKLKYFDTIREWLKYHKHGRRVKKKSKNRGGFWPFYKLWSCEGTQKYSKDFSSTFYVKWDIYSNVKALEGLSHASQVFGY